MPTTLSKEQIMNSALARIGVKPVADFADLDSIPAEQCLLQWDFAFSEIGRAHAWNCLLKPAVLQVEEQEPITPADPVPASTPWAPGTVYAVGDYVTYGDPAYLYQALIANTATASFTNDLTAGYWLQTDIYDANPFSGSGANYPSGWSYKYPLPEDCLLLAELNDQPCKQGYKQDWEIMGSDLYTNDSRAVIKYVSAEPDTTRYDSLFVGCLVLLLASKIATILRQDDTNISTTMLQLYSKAMHEARAKDGAEKIAVRFDPVANSRFVGSRFRSTNY